MLRVRAAAMTARLARWNRRNRRNSAWIQAVRRSSAPRVRRVPLLGARGSGLLARSWTALGMLVADGRMALALATGPSGRFVGHDDRGARPHSLRLL